MTIDNLVEDINRYYIDTAWDYKYLWISEALALHFGYYDKQTRNHKDAVMRMNEVMAEKAEIKSGEKIIDAGCGIGGSSIWLAKNKNCEVTGINIVDTQLLQATKNATEAGLGNKVKFLKADYTHLPIDENVCDVFWALESVVHAPNKAGVVKEAFRVLNKGGRIVMAEYLLRENPPLSKEENAYLLPWLQGWSMPSLETISGYREYLKSAGFENIQFFNVNKNVRPSLRRLRLLCNLALPGARVMELFGLFSRERVANIEASLRQISAFDKGYWDYFIITASKLS